MKIVTTTSVFPLDYPCEKALIRLADCGFEYLDLAMDYCADNKDCPFSTDAWESWANALRELGEKHGVKYTHSHAWGDASSRNLKTFRSLEVAKVLGAEYSVIHPIYKHSDGSFIYDDEEFIRTNAEALKPLVEFAEKQGVMILSENILWGASIKATAISALVKEVNSPYFGWCYDTGHANVHHISCRELLKCEIAPISLHIQDNHGTYADEHLMPGDGDIDWKEFLDTLKEIGYKGEMVLEAHHQSLDAKDEDREPILKEIYRRADKMREYFLR
jgi:sugar phosphate isomerase/epimerase